MVWETRPCALCGHFAGFANDSLGPLLGPVVDISTGKALIDESLELRYCSQLKYGVPQVTSTMCIANALCGAQR